MWIPRKLRFLVQICFFVLSRNIICFHGESNQQLFVGATEGKVHNYFFLYQRQEYPRDCHEVLHRCSSTSSSGVYLIKPDGYAEPFEVYCDNSVDDGGWTIIQRRFDGSINFNRSWEDYQLGFGFLSSELWIGNKRLSYLTNQKRYQLRIDLTTTDGSSFNVTYDAFRISDDSNSYKIVKAEITNRTVVFVDNYIEWCPTNKTYNECQLCEATCADPDSCINTSCKGSHSCVCPDGFLMNGDNCIRIEDCGCFMENETDGERGVLLKEGEIYVSPNCDKKCSCTDNHLSCDDSYQCDPNADCEERNGLLQCYCPPGYSGDGTQCRPTRGTVPSDCKELYNNGERTSGVYEIQPTNWPDSPFEVYCNMSDGGGWTVFQRRVDASQDFYLFWDDYKIGFGNRSRNFWLGNEKIYGLTNQRPYELRIDFVDKNGDPYYAKYDFFCISDENDNFRLDVGNYSDGDAGDSLTDHDNQPFTTRDKDNDDYDLSDYSSEKNNLARSYDGAWWYMNYDYDNDYFSSLNGPYASYSFYWNTLPGSFNYIKFTEMKVRAIDEE
ncbi:uncharacterized protein [Apostichopus japonicus]|uniref:uncharacterized protein isoform X1 n=1 Tax=Stichopus japonicus TaxID=307972 RepID=UPI003AB25B4C